MASVDVPVSILAKFKSQDLVGNDEKFCNICWDPENSLEMLISELKSTRLIIKLLQEGIKSTSTVIMIQANLTDQVDHNIDGKFILGRVLVEPE